MSNPEFQTSCCASRPCLSSGFVQCSESTAMRVQSGWMPRRKYASHQRRSAAGQVMKRESIEERIKSHFKLEGGACASALSEVQDCFESSVYLDAILQEVGSSAATKEEAIVKWAIIRGEQWVGMSFLPGPTYTRKNLRGRWAGSLWELPP